MSATVIDRHSRQLYPVLNDATESALRASIQRFGVLVAVVSDQHGQIIDGHHRSRVATELGVAFETKVVNITSEDEAREIARTLNEDRRMLTREQRLPVVMALREERHSQRAIAGALGVGKTTIVRDLASQVVTPDHLPAETTGLDGKTYPASKPKTEFYSTPSRRGYRKNRDTPFELKSERDTHMAGAQRGRVRDGLSEISGICRGMRDLDFGIAVAACTDDEWRMWIAKAGDLSRALADLKRRMTEVGSGKEPDR